MKKIKTISWCGLVSATVFSLLNISFNADISLVAFPLSVMFTVFLYYFSVVKMFKNNDIKSIPPYRKLIQYEPYAYLAIFIFRRSGENSTVFAVELLSVIFWVIIAASSFLLQYFLSEKRIYSYNKDWQKITKNWKKEKKSFAFSIIFEAIDWIDALLQAVFMVLLIQIFFFQLYQIPSESMVPEFLIKDRVVVGKTASGPKFPLSEIGLPYMRSYKRGDIVVFRNPHYIIDRKSEIKTFVSQLVYMLSFTTVNLNVDEQGNPKADPLVKRVAGVAGEQLVMLDGILYSRTEDTVLQVASHEEVAQSKLTKDSSQSITVQSVTSPTKIAEMTGFKPVELDLKKAAWNLNSLPENTKKSVQWFPFAPKNYEQMLECEENRRNLDLEKSFIECQRIARDFEQLLENVASKTLTKNSNSTEFFATGGTIDENALNLFTKSELFEYSLFSQNLAITQKLLTAKGGATWFTKFMTDWFYKNNVSNNFTTGDIYKDSNFRLNIMIKLAFGKIILRNAQLMFSNLNAEQKSSDSVREKLFQEAEKLHKYILLLDRRNMPIFPANDSNGNPQFIPENCYFMMGDNRFNSLDMRHSYAEKLIALTSLDDYSVMYYSNIAPQYVNRKYILGTTSFRFWPVNRIGKL